jgi:NAD(P)-dependent dehydrogenase (short-subunit alcohol dehydrogenase family)
MAAFNKDDEDEDCLLMSLHVTDVTNKTEVEETVNTIIKQWGGIDILINNAGTSQSPRKGTLETLSADDLRSLLDLNVVGVHIVTSAVLRQSMLPAKDGKIINISSRAGKVGYPSMSHYCASKFALEGLTAALAEEVRDMGIQVNSYSPGLVNTKSFPKPDGRKGVRSADSIDEGLFVLLDSGVTGHYMHADELDVVREKKLDDSVALKPISEAIFSP